jgi:hypothetical protein
MTYLKLQGSRETIPVDIPSNVKAARCRTRRRFSLTRRRVSQRFIRREESISYRRL